jgi:tetratricopeptide (TPR) repeat protein
MLPKTFSIVALLCLLMPASLQAQRTKLPPTINGQVRFGDNNAPADFVLVRAEATIGGLATEVRTDRSGKFTIVNLDSIAYNLTIKAPGYLDARQSVDLATSTNAYVVLSLVPDKGARIDNPKSASYVLDARVPQAARNEFDAASSILGDPKRIDEVVKHLEKAVSIDADFREAQLLLATTYMDAKQWDKAETLLKQLVKSNDHPPAAFFALGEIYLQQRKYKEAAEVLQGGLRLDDNSWRGHLALGRAYFAMDDLAKAGPEVGRALELKPDSAEAHLFGGNILFKSRQAEKALPLFEEYLRLEPSGTYAAETRELVVKIKKALGMP